MPYSKEKITLLVKKIVGEHQLESLGLPRAAEEAALMIFLNQKEYISKEEQSLIREYLLELKERGFIKFTKSKHSIISWDKAYDEGLNAFRNNMSSSSCQYKIGSMESDCWLEGWYNGQQNN
jgi:hypothetical protein